MKKYKMLVEAEVEVQDNRVAEFEKGFRDDLPFVGSVGQEEDGVTVTRVVVKVDDVSAGKPIIGVTAAA